jgi:hypothetical protein
MVRFPLLDGIALAKDGILAGFLPEAHENEEHKGVLFLKAK